MKFKRIPKIGCLLFTVLLSFGQEVAKCATLLSLEVVSSNATEREKMAFDFIVFDKDTMSVRFCGGTAQVRQGSLWLLNGRYLLMKDVTSPKGLEIDVLDGAVLQFQFFTRLFAEALPQGPSAIKRKTNINLASKTKPIELHTASAEAEYPAPWEANGSVERMEEGKLSFQIEFKCSSEGKKLDQTMSLRGTWLDKDVPCLADTEAIESWSQYLLGRSSDGNVVDYVARPIKRCKTVGELKKLHARD